MNRFRLAFAFATSLAPAGSAAAHPGHGSEVAPALHFLTEPMHAPAVLGALAVVGFAALLLARRAARHRVERSPRR